MTDAELAQQMRREVKGLCLDCGAARWELFTVIRYCLPCYRTWRDGNT